MPFTEIKKLGLDVNHDDNFKLCHCRNSDKNIYPNFIFKAMHCIMMVDDNGEGNVLDLKDFFL